MPTKLKGLKIKRVALVDEGANPDAYIKFAKSKDGPEPMEDAELTSEEAIGIFDRFAGFVRKMLGSEKIDKSALTFANVEERRNYDKVMSEEVYPMVGAFMDSVCSIVNDVDKSAEEKASLLKQSVTEFSETFGSCASAWSEAKLAQANVAKGDDVLVKMRDSINDLIAKKADGGEEQPDDEDDDEDGDSPEDSEDEDKDGKKKPPVKKGATNMEFDTSKMTPEEKAQFDDLAKRFGKPDAPAPAPTPAPAPAVNPQPAADDEVVKGMRAELDELRKFKQEAENRELAEVAKRYTIIGKKPEELLPVLKSMKAAGKDVYDQFIAGLDGAVKAVEESGAFSEIGKRGTSSTSTDDAWGKIEAAAHEIIKSKPDMRWPDAVDAACTAHPELVDEYEKSRR